jgi:redox-sensitive bicupin YhaK (pirin superfamily)
MLARIAKHEANTELHMSVESTTASPEERSGNCSSIERFIHPKKHDLGGFSVRRVLPAAGRRMVGPWIFFDHMGPATFPPGQGIDLRPHPHINLATVTYLFEGEMLHRDSLGHEAVIRPGEINLMVAGRGIVHSERQRDEVKSSDNTLEGLQLWLALPEADEEMEPEFHHYGPTDIPQIEVESVAVRVLIGAAYGARSPVKTFAETLYVEAELKAGQSLVLPDNVEERAVYVARGQLSARGNLIDRLSMAVFAPERKLAVTATEDTRIAIVGGQHLPPRHIWWNFVSSRKERIEQAKRDWLSEAFPNIPGDDIEFIPLPER